MFALAEAYGIHMTIIIRPPPPVSCLLGPLSFDAWPALNILVQRIVFTGSASSRLAKN